MKRQFALLSSLLLGLVVISPALADGWYEHHDHNGDGKWNYSEFRQAHNNWYRDHHDKHYGNRELRDQFNRFDTDHHGYVTREQVRTFHNWE